MQAGENGTQEKEEALRNNLIYFKEEHKIQREKFKT